MEGFKTIVAGMMDVLNTILLPAAGQTPISMLAWAGLLFAMLFVTTKFIKGLTKA